MITNHPAENRTAYRTPNDNSVNPQCVSHVPMSGIGLIRPSYHPTFMGPPAFSPVTQGHPNLSSNPKAKAMTSREAEAPSLPSLWTCDASSFS